VALYFLDSSALVKRYITETGTAWVQALTDPSSGHVIYLARITAVELSSAVTRRQRGGSLSAAAAAAVLAQFAQDFAYDYRILEITPTVVSSACSLAETHGLRAYDAVQLAAVLGLRSRRFALGLSDVTLLSADHELNAAAIASGLLVEDPNSHP
jgi:predicted nucleic acid-binding protein